METESADQSGKTRFSDRLSKLPAVLRHHRSKVLTVIMVLLVGLGFFSSQFKLNQAMTAFDKDNINRWNTVVQIPLWF